MPNGIRSERVKEILYTSRFLEWEDQMGAWDVVSIMKKYSRTR